MNILLVDDSKSVALVTGSRLKSFGHEVVHAPDGASAVALFQQGHFDLILMDIEMPNLNGFETTTQIRALEGNEPWAWTPIIFVTATDTATNLITAIEAGGDDFISKLAPEGVLRAKMKAMSRIAALRSRLALANEQLQDQAQLDSLTGLFNRRMLDKQVEALWGQAIASKMPFGLLMVDIDNFKKYNDHHGHQAGDECLREVARCISKFVQRTSDEGMARGAFVARYGGEEFAVVIPDALEGIHARMGSGIVEAVAALKLPHGKNPPWGIVTLSIGSVRADPACGRLSGVFREADARLYRAKDAGRNRCEAQSSNRECQLQGVHSSAT